jgi:CDP-diacylglycerol pyrophosphatase
VNRKLFNLRGLLLPALLFLVFSASRCTLAQDEKPQTAQAPSASQAPAKPSILLALAKKCAGDIATAPGCRTFTTNDQQQYIILKDKADDKPQGFLLIPVQPVTGVEDDKVFSPSVADLWASAWLWSEKYPGKSATVTGLAVNSVLARTQNQLHIHISCVLPDVTKALGKKKISQDANHPTLVKLGSNHTTYSVVAVPTLDGANSPFLIARTISQANKIEMRQQGIAVVRGKKNNGFYVLATAERQGAAEELLDQACASK